MGKALELLTGIVTAAAGATVDLTMAGGNSLTVRNASQGSMIRLVNAWADVQTVAVMRIRSPQLHDNVQGIHFNVPIGDVEPLLPFEQVQHLVPQDTLQVDLTDATAGILIDTVSMLVQYDDLPGVSGIFLTSDEVRSRMKNVVTIRNNVLTTVVGNYTGQQAINTTDDLLRANTEYAILGYQVNNQCASVRWLSSDFGNLGVGGPGSATDKNLTAKWFMHMSDMTQLPLIPVFNSANAASVLIDVASDEVIQTVIVNTIVAQLS